MRFRLGSIAFIAGALLISASPAHAHGGAEGSALSPLSIGLGIGGFLALILAALVSTKGHRRVGVVVFAAGIVLIGLAGVDIAADSSKEEAPESLAVEVLEPVEGATVTSPVRFRVRVEGGTFVPLAQLEGEMNQGHLHIAVDGRTVDMPVTSEFVVDIPPGVHVIQIEFTAADHVSYEPPVQKTFQIRVLAPGDAGPSPATETAGAPTA